MATVLSALVCVWYFPWVQMPFLTGSMLRFAGSMVSPGLLCTVSMVRCMLYGMPFGLYAICCGFVGISYGPTCNIGYFLLNVLWGHKESHMLFILFIEAYIN